MNKLRKIINQLDDAQLGDFLKTLKTSHNSKNYKLVISYKENKLNDDEIRTDLECTENSYYVLKSRMYDKVQKFLLENKSEVSDADVDEINVSLNKYIFNHAPETSIAILLELEKKHLNNDSPVELIKIYSALKKLHFYTDKYYHFSQLYNSQVAYSLALEKAEETLFNFNRTLANYFFSDNPENYELLRLLKKEIKNIQSLNSSHRIELIMNIIILEAGLFAGIESEDDVPFEDLLKRCDEILEKYPADSSIVFYKNVVQFLYFEYYLSLNQLKKAKYYYDNFNNADKFWLLNNNICLAFKYLLSKTYFTSILKINETSAEEVELMQHDTNDIFSVVILRYYKAVTQYNNGKIKQAINTLNNLLNDISFTNYFYIESEIKLTLSYYYFLSKDFEMGEATLRGIIRKLQGLKTDKFKNIKEAVKLISFKFSNPGKNGAKRYNDLLDQFDYTNQKEKGVLFAIRSELSTL